MLFAHIKHLASEAFQTCAQPCHKTVLFFGNAVRQAPAQPLPDGDEKQPLPPVSGAGTPFIRHYIKQPR